MKRVLQKKGNYFGYSPLTGSRGLMGSLVVLGVVLMLTPSFAQSIKMDVSTKKVPEGKLEINGTVSASNLLPKDQRNVGNNISILFEYIEAGGKYRILPDSLQIRPRGLLKDNKILTKEEEVGVKARSIEIWSLRLDNQKDEGKTFTFEKTIPTSENAVSYRIVAFLNHSWSGTWPAYAYKYDVHGPHPVEVTAHPVEVTDSDGDEVPDSEDECPDTCKELKVNAKGCPDSEHVFDEAYKQLIKLKKEYEKKYGTRFRFHLQRNIVIDDTRFQCLWKMLDPDGKFLGRKGKSDDQWRLMNKFEETHEYFNSPAGKHMERLPNTASQDFYCHDWAWYLWRLHGTRKVEPKAPGSKVTSNGLPIDGRHIDQNRIMNDPEAYGFKEIKFHDGVYRELRAGDVIIYSNTIDGKANHSAVVNSNRGTGNPDDVICLSKAEGNSIFKHSLGRFGDLNNYFQKTFALKKIRIFRPVDEPGRRKNFYER